jgi:uncharacterized protein (TIGR02145 family)
MKKHIEYLLDSQLAFLVGAISFINMQSVFESFFLIQGSNEWKLHSITNDIDLLTYSIPATFLSVAMALPFLRKQRSRRIKIVAVPAMAILLYLITFISCYISSLVELPKNEIIKMNEFFSEGNIFSIIGFVIFYSPVIALAFFIAGKLKNKNPFLKIAFMPAVYWIYDLFLRFFAYLLPDPDIKFEEIPKIYYISDAVLSEVIICLSVALIFIGIPLVAEVYYKKQQLMKKLTALLALLGVATLLGVAIFAQEKGTFTDPRDKKTYKTTKIGTQTWMAENLNFNANGSKCDDDDPANCQKYGRLYNWNTAMKACPKGWHLPSNAEWDKLYRFADGTSGTESPYISETAGKLLKTTSGWMKDGNGTDEYGFSALPGGDGGIGDWWSATENDGDIAYFRFMFYDDEYAHWGNFNKGGWLSVRCLQD